MKNFSLYLALFALASCCCVNAFSDSDSDSDSDSPILLYYNGFASVNTHAKPNTPLFATWCNNTCAPFL